MTQPNSTIYGQVNSIPVTVPVPVPIIQPVNELVQSGQISIPDQKSTWKQRTWLLTIFAPMANMLFVIGVSIILYKYPWIREALKLAGVGDDFLTKIAGGSLISTTAWTIMEKFKDAKMLPALINNTQPQPIIPSVPIITPDNNNDDGIDLEMAG